MMQQESQRKKSKQSDKSMLSAQDFPVSLSALLGQDEVLKTQMELSSLKSQGSLPFSNLSIYSSRTSRGLLAMIKGIPLRQSSDRWMNWGYDVEWQVLNSKDFGVPQNRERCYIVGHLRGTSGRQIFPIAETRSDKSIMQLGNIKKTESFGGNPQCGRIYSIDGLAPCLNTMQGGQREPKILIDGKVRKLTPRECWRLQGFPDWAFDKAQEVNSNSQLYKQAGNSVTVNVIAAIAKELK